MSFRYLAAALIVAAGLAHGAIAVTASRYGTGAALLHVGAHHHHTVSGYVVAAG